MNEPTESSQVPSPGQLLKEELLELKKLRAQRAEMEARIKVLEARVAEVRRVLIELAEFSEDTEGKPIKELNVSRAIHAGLRVGDINTFADLLAKSQQAVTLILQGHPGAIEAVITALKNDHGGLSLLQDGEA